MALLLVAALPLAAMPAPWALALQAVQAEVAPQAEALVQHHPLAVVGGVAAAGAVLAWWQPWRHPRGRRWWRRLRHGSLSTLGTLPLQALAAERLLELLRTSSPPSPPPPPPG